MSDTAVEIVRIKSKLSKSMVEPLIDEFDLRFSVDSGNRDRLGRKVSEHRWLNVQYFIENGLRSFIKCDSNLYMDGRVSVSSVGDSCRLNMVLEATGKKMHSGRDVLKCNEWVGIEVEKLKEEMRVRFGLVDVFDISVGQRYNCGKSRLAIDIVLFYGIGKHLFEVLSDLYIAGKDSIVGSGYDRKLDRDDMVIRLKRQIDINRYNQSGIVTKRVRYKKDDRIDMKWSNIYDEYIDIFVKRGYLKEDRHDAGLEAHHIIPKCMDGKDDEDNLVVVTIEEHTLLHCILCLAYPDHYGLLSAFILRVIGINEEVNYLYFKEIERSKQAAIEKIKEGVEFGIIEATDRLKKELAKFEF